jgi:hypothetical protein
MTDGDVHSNEMPHDPLDAFFDDLRAAAAETPTPAVGDALATLFRDGAAPVTSVIGSRRWRWSMRATVAGAVAGVAFGGLGVAGALPRPVQHGVAGVVRHVGVELPDPATTTTTEPTVPTTRPAFVPTPSTNDDDHGPSTTAPGDGGSGTGTRSEDQGPGRSGDSRDDRSGDGKETTTTVAGGGDHHGDEGSGDERRNSVSAADVHPGDGSQAAGRDDYSGGTTE